MKTNAANYIDSILKLILRAYKLKAIALWFLGAICVYLILFRIGNELINQFCGGTHSPFNFICSLGRFAPEISGIFAGVFFGWKKTISTSMLSVFIPIVALLILWKLGHLENTWYGSQIWYFVMHFTFDSVIPTVIFSVATACLTSKRR